MKWPSWSTRSTDSPVSTRIPSSPNTRVSSALDSGSSTARIRSATSSTVTSQPKRENACASSHPIGPPPITASERGSSVTFTISRLVQYGVASSPSIGSDAGDVPTSSTTPRAATYSSSPTRTRPGPSSRSGPPDDPDAGVLQPFDVGVVLPVVGRLLVDPVRDGAPVGVHLGATGEVVDPSPLAERVGRADHDLRGDAAVERALAAHQVAVDPDHRQPGLGQLLGGVLAAGAEPEHHHVHVMRRHVAQHAPRRGSDDLDQKDPPRCRAGGWGHQLEDAVRRAAASYVGGRVGEIALTDSTTQGIATLYGASTCGPRRDPHDHPRLLLHRGRAPARGAPQRPSPPGPPRPRPRPSTSSSPGSSARSAWTPSVTRPVEQAVGVVADLA